MCYVSLLLTARVVCILMFSSIDISVATTPPVTIIPMGRIIKPIPVKAVKAPNFVNWNATNKQEQTKKK